MHLKRFLLASLLVVAMAFFVRGLTVQDVATADFNNGTFNGTIYNSSSGFLQLNNSGNFYSGSFISRVFSVAGAARWNNISWVQDSKYGFELPNNTLIESEFGGANMSGNVLLLHLNDGGGTFKDSSGFGNNGTLTGVISYNATGKYGKAIDAGGSTGRIAIPTAGTILNFNQTITIEAWIKWDGESGENFNLQNVVTAGNFRRALRVTEPDHFNGGSQLLSYFNIGGTDLDLYSNADLPTGVWTHIATTYNGTGLTIYINGRYDNSMAASGLIAENNDNVYIAAEAGSVSNFDGIIDEVAIYNRSLSAQEILRRYERGASALNVSARSCADSTCSSGSFTLLGATSPQQLSLSNNTYFQYKFDFATENLTATPKVYNLTIDYTLSNVAPSVQIVVPSSNSILRSNVSIPLNFSASDGDENLQSCWYTLNSGLTNITLLNCANTTFNSSNGLQTLFLYANDSIGLIGNSSVSFSVDSVYPLVSLVYPANISYTTTVSQLNYTLSDANIQSCWYTLNNGVANVSVSCSENVSGLTVSQGSNTWMVYVNDSAGNINSSSVTFNVDSVFPEINYVSPSEISGSILSKNFILVNVTVSDTNPQSVVVRLFNSSSAQINSSTSGTSPLYINFSGLSDGFYYFNATVNDSFGNVNYTITRNVTVDNGAPFVSFVSPSNLSYRNATILVNISSNGDYVWFFNGTGNESYIGAVYRDFLQGSNALFAYANDSVGNMNFSNVTFNVDSILPSLEIVHPASGSTFGYNTSLSLNYTVSDTNLQRCWYNLDNSNNISLSSCQNITFNISEGSHSLNLFANDSFANVVNVSSSFNVQIGAPSISLTYPIGEYLNNNTGIQFTYTPSDLDLQSCQLWGNFNGTFMQNQTNNSVVSGTESSFFLNLPDANYSWGVFCNDSAGHVSFAGNESFYVDTTLPSASLSAPSGSYSSRTGIPISFSSSDASPIICYYRVYRGNTIEVSTTSLSCSAGSGSFSVTLDADFVFALFVEDTLGHIRNVNSSFSVATTTSSSSPPSSSGGGGGGGGGGGSGFVVSGATGQAKVEFNSLDKKLKLGASDVINFEVLNNGLRFLNRCSLKFSGERGGWFSNNEVKSFASGQSVVYGVSVSVPSDAEFGIYPIPFEISCNELNMSSVLNFEVIKTTFGFEYLRQERIDVDSLIIHYRLRDFAGKDKNVVLNYRLLNPNGIEIVNEKINVGLSEGEVKESSIKMDLPKGAVGEFKVELLAASELDSLSLNVPVLLSSRGLTGLAISSENQKALYYSVGILGGFAIIYFAYRFFLSRHARMHKATYGRHVRHKPR